MTDKVDYKKIVLDKLLHHRQIFVDGLVDKDRHDPPQFWEKYIKETDEIIIKVLESKPEDQK